MTKVHRLLNSYITGRRGCRGFDVCFGSRWATAGGYRRKKDAIKGLEMHLGKLIVDRSVMIEYLILRAVEWERAVAYIAKTS